MRVTPNPDETDRFAGIRRDFGPLDVERLAGSFRIRHTLAEMGATRLWHLLKNEHLLDGADRRRCRSGVRRRAQRL